MIKLSHSKLGCILSCPMTYHLNYELGISKKVEKPALAIGSAVHWGIEHNTEDLTDYFTQNGTIKSRNDYTRDQILAESMVHGYMKHKDEIFEEMLRNNETGEKYELVDETHELYTTGDLHSSATNMTHKFVGIIDLLLLTNKGFIVIDYKTSSMTPDWSKYLDQIYRYIFMLKTTFPDIPIIKIGIINIRKTSIRQKKNENLDQFFNRMKFEYDINDENYVNYHEYSIDALDPLLINDYTTSLSRQCDLAQMIVDKGVRFINFAAAEGQYGKSDYWEIFHRVPDCHLLYSISDHIWNEDTQEFESRRDCVPIDMRCIDDVLLLNKYDIFKKERETYVGDNFIEFLYEKYAVDKDLLDRYILTYDKELESK